jgi:GH25 family lysozyme M1 (1,4-beta-N-acetylmuramidase)
MKLLLLLLGVTAALASAGPLQVQAALPRYAPEGIDVRDVDGEVNWDLWKNKGYTFAYIKATGGSCKQQT